MCTVCNYLPKHYSTDNVNYSYYIEKAENIISKIQLGGKFRKIVVIPNQISMFN